MPHRTTCYVYLANVKTANLVLHINIAVGQFRTDVYSSLKNGLGVGIGDTLGPEKVSR